MHLHLSLIDSSDTYPCLAASHGGSWEIGFSSALPFARATFRRMLLIRRSTIMRQ